MAAFGIIKGREMLKNDYSTWKEYKIRNTMVAYYFYSFNMFPLEVISHYKFTQTKLKPGN